MNRAAKSYRTQSGPKRALWRRLLRWVGLMLAFLMFPIVAFLIWNAIDEAPSAAALRYAVADDRSVADADNAWLLLAGLGAAIDEEPQALGTRRVEAYRARASVRPTPVADAEEHALFVERVAAVEPDAARDGFAAYCDVRSEDCVHWAGLHREALQRLQQSNALRLLRFEAALGLSDWQVLYPSEIDPRPVDLSVADLHASLIALEVFEQRDQPDAASAAAALERLVSTVEFWQRVRQPPQDLWSILVSGNQIERAYLIADAWLDGSSAAAVRANADRLDRLLAEPARTLDWSVAMSADYRSLARTLDDGLPGRWGSLRRCFTDEGDFDCASMLLTSMFYAPQATLNLHAMHREQMQRVLEASPADLPGVSATAGAQIEASLPRLDDAAAVLPQLTYNFAGRVLAAIAIPSYDWGQREHDREALRRLLSIKREAIQRAISPAAMPAFLLDQPKRLRNPLTGMAFEHDGQGQVLHFVPSAERRWPQARVELRY